MRSKIGVPILRNWQFMIVDDREEKMTPGERCQLSVELAKFVRGRIESNTLDAYGAYCLIGELTDGRGRRNKNFVSAPIDSYRVADDQEKYRKIFPYAVGKIVIARDNEGREFALSIAGKK